VVGTLVVIIMGLANLGVDQTIMQVNGSVRKYFQWLMITATTTFMCICTKQHLGMVAD
jgi:hypothetical protein